MLEGTAAQSLRFTLHVVEKERIADNGVLNIWHPLSTQLQNCAGHTIHTNRPHNSRRQKAQ